MDAPVKQTRHIALGLISIASLILAASCSASSPSPSQPAAASDPPQVAAPPSSGPVAKTTTAAVNDDSSDLDALWNSRMAAQPTNSESQFALGPGDLLKVSVPEIPQLKDRDVRVSEQSTIALPLVGEINVAGMSEEDLRNELAKRVGKYMYHPQVEVFLQHTENRQVAVIGAVKVPGRYTLSSRNDTIMTMISHAGGLSDESSTRIILIPAGDGPTKGQSALPDQPSAQTQTAPDLRLAAADPTKVSPVSMNQDTADALALRMMSRRVIINTVNASQQRYLEIPAMPGDVIIVPAAGEVTVQGWVDKGGSFKIDPGMTAMGAIAAAGGAMFSGTATLLREQDDGRKIQIPLDLSKIKSGEEPDVQVQSGDVVVVERSAVGAVPYSLYFLISHIGMGIGFPAI
jgi:polysaccharide biosynthesis/export protein